MAKKKLILGSGSPRRRELLLMITPEFTVQSAEADETLPEDIDPTEAVERLSLRKAEAVLAMQQPGAEIVVIGADTVVAIDGAILGKPHSPAEAAAMLRQLSGREHTVCTGVTVLAGDACHTFHQSTAVRFYPLTEKDIAWYTGLAEPYDKAGGYGIQGAGAQLVAGITGDYFNVMGLPVALLSRVLREMGIVEW